jgi:hypothetical protein
MENTRYPLQFDRADLEPMRVEELSVHMRVSRAFIRQCLDSGCPTQQGRISAARLMRWLFENYQVVRLLAGLKPLVSIEGVFGKAAAKLKMGNALITLFEFSERRSSVRDEKRRLRDLRLHVEQALDRA